MPPARDQRLSRWLLPTFAAPFLTATTFVTLSVWGSRFAFPRWLGLMLVANLAALILAVALLLCDWVLLLVRLRAPPVGPRAWASSALSTIVAYLLWGLVRPPLLSPPSTHAVSLAGVLIFAALAVRFVTSPRPDRGGRFH